MKSISQILSREPSQSQYDDPRWKDRARSFRSSYGRFCQSCRRSGIVIHVHHVNYHRGKNLWDYDDQDLAMLCEPCHELIHKSILAYRQLAGHSNAKHIAAITGLIDALIKKHGDLATAIKLAEVLAK